MDPGGAGLPPIGAFNDYAKVGAWNDCVYQSANEFDQAQPNPTGDYIGAALVSLSRADLYAGAPLTWAIVYLPNTVPNNIFTALPSHNLGSGVNAPAPGTPNYFVNEEAVAGFNWIVRKFTAGPNCGAGGSVSAPVSVSQAAYNFNVGDDVPQPNTTNKLDALIDRLMQKNIYRKVNGVESLWVTHTVGDSPLTRTGMQWAQINVTGGTIATTPVQEGIHMPDAVWRWMGSLAVDGQGNMALGYSTSGPSAPDFPSIKYAGRLAGDPLNTLPQTETTLIAGAGSQVNNCGGAPCHRWGDYSSMSVDPSDDCTFWYTNQYYSSQTTGNTGNWQTRIGSFRFPSCTAPLSGSTRTFVSVDGLDANPCSATSPCRTLSHAISLTTPGGEIQVLDSGGYGGLTIDRPITIAASEGVYAGVTVSSGDGITVNPGPSGPVILRGLTINSTGGNRGIVQQSGTALHVEDCVISNFGVDGIHAMPATTSSLYLRNSELRGNQVGVSVGTTVSGSYTVQIDRSTFAKNAQAGLDIATTGRGASGAIRNTVFTGNGYGVIMRPLAGTTAKLELRKTTFDTNTVTGLFVGSAGSTTMANVASSTFSSNAGGIGAAGGGTIHVADSTIIRNTTGLSPGAGSIVSFGNNRLLQNTANGSFSSTISPQ
jgi:hypothetical protein